MASVANEEAKRLFRVTRTIVQMCIDRQYLVPPEEKNLTLEDFCEKFEKLPSREAMVYLYRKKDDPTDCIFVFFPEDPKVGVKPIRKYCDRMKEEAVNRAIIVLQQGMSAFAKQALQEMQQIKLETFTEAELLVNITEHNLVPEHIPLSTEDKTLLLEKYKLKEAQLPRIQKEDPVARYFGLDRGTVIKIVRPSETAGRYVTYRLVI